MAVSPLRRPDQLTGGRHGLTAAEVQASQRERILRAMTAAVGEQGFHGTRVADVVWRAGVSRKTFYELFSGKDDCFCAAYDEWVARFLRRTFEAFDAQTEWIDKLRAAITTLLGELSCEPAAARACFVEVLGAGDAAMRRRDAAMVGLGELFVAPDAPDGALGDALRLGRVGELSEILRREIAAGRTAQLPRLTPDLMSVLVLPFLGVEAARSELMRARTAVP